MEYYIAVKIDIVEPHATMRMNLNRILRGKKKQDTKEYIQYDSIYVRLKTSPHETVLLKDVSIGCKTTKEGKKDLPQNPE